MASTQDPFQPAPSVDPMSDAPSSGTPATGEAAPPRKRAARKSTKKASPAGASPAEASSAEASAAEPGNESAGNESAADGPAAGKPAKKTAKKAAAKKTAKKATKKTATKKAAADDVALEPASSAPTGTSEAPSSESAPAASTAPGVGVLFQAPAVPAAPRARKRAAAKAEQEQKPEREPDGRTEDLAADEHDDSADQGEGGGRRRRRRGGKGRGRGRSGSEGPEGSEAQDQGSAAEDDSTEAETSAGDQSRGQDQQDDDESGTSKRRRRRRRSGSATDGEDPPGTVTKVRQSRRDEPQSVKGSTRLEAKKQRRREGREAGRRRTVITEAEFLARRESVDRRMVVREREGRTQIGVLEDDVLVEHFVSRETNASMAGNVYLGRVQNVLPSMEAAFVDIGKGRNAVLYAGEVNWDAAGLDSNQPKRIENALKSGDSVLVQVTKDPIGHKGARLTSQISLPGRYLVFVPEGSMTGISRKLPDTERSRLKGILKEVLPDSAGVIVRTAAEGASEEELRADVERLTRTWEKIQAKAESKAKAKGGAPVLVHGEPDLTVRVIRDVFNEDFGKLVVSGEQAWSEVSDYVGDVAPDLAERLEKWTSEEDLFTHYRVDEQIAKAMDRKVWLPSGGSLVIDRTEAMTVVDVNTGKFVGSGGNLEETVTKNNIEAAEEIVRQLRLRDIGGIIVIDFIDMVLESNRDLVVRRLLECLGRDRTKHQVAEVTSLGLVQMTRKRVGSGLIEVFSETCEHCAGRGIIVHADPVEKGSGDNGSSQPRSTGRGRRGRGAQSEPQPAAVHSGPTPAQIAAAAHAAALKSSGDPHDEADLEFDTPLGQDEPVGEVHEAEDQEPMDQEPMDEEPLDHEQAAVDPEPARQPVAEPVPAAQPVAEPARTPRRRKRGRVVAPAGPPRHAGDEAANEPTTEPTTEPTAEATSGTF
jgi:ribonuclease E